MLAHVLAIVRSYGPAATIVVLGHGADAVEAGVTWADEVRVRNPAPERGIASSLAAGLDAMAGSSADIAGAFVVLGDQPALRRSVLVALEEAAADDVETRGRPFIVPRYADDPAPRNPVLVLREAWPILAELEGDRGLGPIIEANPELVVEVPVAGAMPDVDRPEDLDSLAARRPDPG
jgi:CTP:molybdopterin cytidylyltransferase MocA